MGSSQATIMRQVKGWWDNHADDWADNRKPFFARRDQLCCELLEESGVTPGTVLDVGCGGGDLSLSLQRLGWEPYGCDLSEKLVAVSARRCGNPERFVQASADDTSRPVFPDQQFDLICCVGVIMYLSDVERSIRWMTSQLKPGGHILLSTANPFSLHTLDEWRAVWSRQPGYTWQKALNLSRYGIWEGVNTRAVTAWRSAAAADRGMKRLGFELVRSIDLYNIGEAADRDPLHRPRGWQTWKARRLAWQHVGLYRLMPGSLAA